MLEAPEELYELLMHQGVHSQLVIKVRLLLRCGKLSHEQEVSAVQKVALLSQVFDVIPVALMPAASLAVHALHTV